MARQLLRGGEVPAFEMNEDREGVDDEEETHSSINVDEGAEVHFEFVEPISDTGAHDGMNHGVELCWSIP